jgi:excisionase family DNA binding protein
MITSEPELCTVREASVMLRVSKATIWRWIDAGRLPALRLGPRTVRLRRGDVRRLASTEARQPIAERLPRGLDPAYVVHTGAQEESADELIGRLRRLQEEIVAGHGGNLFGDSVELVREVRREAAERL